jgi:tRNA-guanine family transglycosylase
LLIALGTPLKGRPRPWECFKVPAIMANAYEIIKNEKLRQEIKAKGGLHKFLRYNGIIFLDSGGFQAMAHGIDIELNSLIEVYNLAKADYYFSLDYPSSSARNSKKKIVRTISNYRELRKTVEQVIPIVHPKIQRAIQEYEVYETYNPPYIAIGGLVPLMMTSKGIYSGRKMAINLIAEIKKRHNSYLHVMGLGAPTVTPILKILKCTSTDSATWRIKAAHGKIMIPNRGERYISKKKARFGIVSINEEDIRAIEKTKCPILKEYGWDNLERSFEVRALLNAWITLHCSEAVAQINGPFSSLLEYAKAMKI